MMAPITIAAMISGHGHRWCPSVVDDGSIARQIN